MRTVRVEKSNTEPFQGLNNENLVIFLDDKDVPVGAKLFPRRKEVISTLPSFNGTTNKTDQDPRLYLTVVQKLKDESDDIFRYWVSHNSDLPEFSWPSEDLAEGMKYDIREDVPWAVIPEPKVEEPKKQEPKKEEPKKEEAPLVEEKTEPPLSVTVEASESLTATNTDAVQ